MRPPLHLSSRLGVAVGDEMLVWGEALPVPVMVSGCCDRKWSGVKGVDEKMPIFGNAVAPRLTRASLAGPHDTKGGPRGACNAPECRHAILSSTNYHCLF